MARSAAEMPVVTPCFASMETVKAVPKRERLSRTIGIRRSLFGVLLGQGEADEPPAVPGHEVDRLRRDELRRHAEVALVLPVLVVDEDDHPAALDIDDRFLDAC